MFTLEQTYDLNELTVLCRAARKTVRKTARVVRWILWATFALLAVLMILLLAMGGAPSLWTWLVLLAMLLFLLLDDRLTAWLSLRQMVPGTAHSTTVFDRDGYTVTTDSTTTVYQYANITGLCETAGHFIFFIGNRHGQIFDKQALRPADEAGFRALIREKTGMDFQTIR